MRRIIIVYNPRSSKHSEIQAEVLSPVKKLRGYLIGKFEVKPVSVDTNAAALSEILLPGDLVVAVGGDGTATVALNGALLSKKDVTLSVLGYGNFNDFARTLGYNNITDIIKDYEESRTLANRFRESLKLSVKYAKKQDQKGSESKTTQNNSKSQNSQPTLSSKSPQSHIKTFYPLEALVDGEHFRYAACYFTIGMFAESTKVFNQKSTRKTLKTGKKGLFYSISALAKWYFKNRHQNFLPPETAINNVPVNRSKSSSRQNPSRVKGRPVSDILFVNSKTVAKIMRGGDWWQTPTDFYLSSGKLTGFFRLSSFMLKSLLKKLPGKVVSSPVQVSFPRPTAVEVQAEGEYQSLTLTTFTVRKTGQRLRVLAK